MVIERKGLEKKFFELVEGVVQGEGYTLYDLEYLAPQKLLRLYIMNPETQTAVIEDCVQVDRALTEPFEKNDWIPEDVVLEVSSPGIYRKLRSREHFEWSLEQRISLKYRGDLDFGEEQKNKALKGQNLIGFLKGVNGDGDFELTVEVPLKDKTINVNIDSKQLVKANCEPEL